MKNSNRILDPRTKFIISFIITGLIIFDIDAIRQLLYLVFLIGISWFVDVDFLQLLNKVKRYLKLLFILIIIQSFFRQGGEIIFNIGEITLLTTEGLKYSYFYVIRVITVLLSGSLIASSSMGDNMQGLVQFKIPYVIGLMVSIALRFMPILVVETKNTYQAIGLRGIDIKSEPLRKRVWLIGQLFIPVVYRALQRAEAMSETIEMRGFYIGCERTSFQCLKMQLHDYGTITLLIVYLGLIVIIR